MKTRFYFYCRDGVSYSKIIKMNKCDNETAKKLHKKFFLPNKILRAENSTKNSVSFYFSSAPQKWSLWSFVIKVIKEIELV